MMEGNKYKHMGMPNGHYFEVSYVESYSDYIIVDGVWYMLTDVGPTELKRQLLKIDKSELPKWEIYYG